MIFFTHFLRKKSIYPFKPTPRVNSHSEEEVCDAVREWLKDVQNCLPPADVTEHAKGSHDMVNHLIEWVSPEGEKKQ